MGPWYSTDGVRGSGWPPSTVVVNKIREAGGEAKYRQRVPEAMTQVVIHRSDIGDTAEEVAEFYRKHPSYTGAKMPYHFFIHKDGTVEQAVELGYIAPGALSLNRQGIQIACHGDFRYKPPTVRQGLALIELCVALCQWVAAAKGMPITGHTELPGRSENVAKECPGRHLPMENLRSLVEERYTTCAPLEAERALLKMGVTI